MPGPHPSWATALVKPRRRAWSISASSRVGGAGVGALRDVQLHAHQLDASLRSRGLRVGGMRVEERLALRRTGPATHAAYSWA